MSNLLKESCNKCTSAKVKCSGGNPCERCEKKGFACSYRPKKKRGPQRKRTNSFAFSEPEHSIDDSFAGISSYERRVWEMFFTMFKNQQNRIRDTQPYAWCWYVSQLKKIREHLKRTCRYASLRRLEDWCRSLGAEINELSSSAVALCTYPPAVCNVCSSMSLSVPRQADGDCCLGPLGTSVKSKLKTAVNSDFELNDGSLPKMLIKMKSHGTEVSVNAQFVKFFGLSEKEVNEAYFWSGGGFLPFGADALALLLVSDKDLLVFLQVLAIKWHSMGLPETGPGVHLVREVPSNFVFPMWVSRDAAIGYNRKCVVLIHLLHLEVFNGDDLCTEIRISFDSVGEPENYFGDDKPVSLDQLNQFKRIKTDYDDYIYKKEHENIPSNENGNELEMYRQHHPVQPQENLEYFNPDIPKDFLDAYSGWDLFDDIGKVEQHEPHVSHSAQLPAATKQQVASYPAADRPCGFSEDMSTMADDGWLSKLLEWSVE